MFDQLALVWGVQKVCSLFGKCIYVHTNCPKFLATLNIAIISDRPNMAMFFGLLNILSLFMAFFFDYFDMTVISDLLEMAIFF